MNNKSLKRIEDVILPSGIFDSIEFNQDVIYLDFNKVELGNPKEDKNLALSIRFADNVFLALFYNDIWDIEFTAKFDFKNPQLYESFNLKVNKIKFIDFEHLNHLFEKFNKNKTLSTNEEETVYNIRNDYFVCLELDNLAVVAGGNQMDFFTEEERLNDDILKELSNKWVLYCLKYHLRRNIRKDSMCEKYGHKG